jgi:hypothetical protein
MRRAPMSFGFPDCGEKKRRMQSCVGQNCMSNRGATLLKQPELPDIFWQKMKCQSTTLSLNDSWRRRMCCGQSLCYVEGFTSRKHRAISTISLTLHRPHLKPYAAQSTLKRAPEMRENPRFHPNSHTRSLASVNHRHSIFLTTNDPESSSDSSYQSIYNTKSPNCMGFLNRAHYARRRHSTAQRII